MNCQTKLRINHLTAVKSVAILEREGDETKKKANPLDLGPTEEESENNETKGTSSVRRLRIWRLAHEAMDPAFLVGTVQGHRGSIMVLGVFSWYCLRSSVRVPTSLNAIQYVEFLGDHFHPFMRSAIRTVMELSSKTTVPLTSPGWLLAA
ncbi:transposable element Tc1 transposase [Trichonephila clavipes]|nr:transposable element Tc1 transposase [Trichonephila clavipes]